MNEGKCFFTINVNGIYVANCDGDAFKYENNTLFVYVNGIISVTFNHIKSFETTHSCDSFVSYDIEINL